MFRPSKTAEESSRFSDHGRARTVQGLVELLVRFEPVGSDIDHSLAFGVGDTMVVLMCHRIVKAEMFSSWARAAPANPLIDPMPEWCVDFVPVVSCCCSVFIWSLRCSTDWLEPKHHN